MEDCIFCRIASGQIPADKVYEDDEMLAFRDINPQAPVHILIIPKRHMANVAECAQEDSALLGRLIARATEIAGREGVSQRGYRLITNSGPDGAQSVGHFHIHLLAGRQLAGHMG